MSQRPDLSQGLLTVDELAAWLKMSRGSLYNLVHERSVPYLKIGARLRFAPAEIAKWLEQCARVEAAPLPALETRQGKRSRQRSIKGGN